MFNYNRLFIDEVDHRQCSSTGKLNWHVQSSNTEIHEHRRKKKAPLWSEEERHLNKQPSTMFVTINNESEQMILSKTFIIKSTMLICILKHKSYHER